MRAVAPWRRWALFAALLAALIAPDLDILLDPLLGRPLFAHHGGWTHSIGAALLFAPVFAAVCRLIVPLSFLHLCALGGAAYLSHALLDACTYGRGVALFWPLTSERFALPIPLFMGVRHSQWHAWQLHLLTILTELAFAALLWTAAWWWRSRTAPRAAVVVTPTRLNEHLERA